MSLAERSLRAVKWNYIGTISRAVAQFVSMIALARLLGPEPTGLFGYAFMLVSFAALAAEMGLSAALVQAPTLDREQLGNVVSRLVIVAIILSTILIALSEWIAITMFNTPSATVVLQAMVPSLIVSALSIPPAAMLRRNLQFRELTLIGLGSYIFGYLFVGIGVAYVGGGVWSLVAAWYAQNLTGCIAMNMAARGSLAWGNPLQKSKMSGFGGIIMVTYLFNWVIDNATHFVIGRVFGPASLGAFTVSNNLVRTPAGHLVTNLQSVLFPASALAQDNLQALRRAYLTALSGVGLVALPLFCGAAATSSLVVDALLGTKWLEAQPLFAPLALAMIPHCLMAIAGPILGGKGEPIGELVVQSLIATILVSALYVASEFGLETLAWAVCFVFSLRFAGMNYALSRRINVSLADIFVSLQGGIVLGASAAVAAVVIQYALASLTNDLPPVPQLVVVMIGITISCSVLLISLPSLCLDNRLSWMASRLLGERPFIRKLPFMRRFTAHLAKSSSAS